MTNQIQQLVDVSQAYGKNPDYVIAGGGNTSYKSEDKLWVKASGTSLSTITEDGFVCLSREELSKIAEKTYSDNVQQREEEVKQDLNACIVSTNGLRPSVETSLHEIIDYSFVVHTHPTLVNAAMCSQTAKATTEELFGTDALFVEYTDPGYILFKKILDRIKEYKAKYNRAPQLIFLENHGIFVAANTVAEIDALYSEVSGKLAEKVATKLLSLETDGSALNELCATLGTAFPDLKAVPVCNELVSYFVKDEAAWNQVSVPFSPDIIVYCKSRYVFAEADGLVEAIKAFNAANNYMPRVLAVKGVGIIALEESEKSASTVIEVFLDFMKICYLAQNFGGYQAMTKEQIAFIDNWEVENYRRKVAKQS